MIEGGVTLAKAEIVTISEKFKIFTGITSGGTFNTLFIYTSDKMGEAMYCGKHPKCMYPKDREPIVLEFSYLVQPK